MGVTKVGLLGGGRGWRREGVRSEVGEVKKQHPCVDLPRILAGAARGVDRTSAGKGGSGGGKGWHLSRGLHSRGLPQGRRQDLVSGSGEATASSGLVVTCGNWWLSIGTGGEPVL